MHLDVTDQASVHAAARVIDDRWGRLDVLVNNAGVSVEGRHFLACSTSGLQIAAVVLTETGQPGLPADPTNRHRTGSSRASPAAERPPYLICQSLIGGVPAHCAGMVAAFSAHLGIAPGSFLGPLRASSSVM
ncbi:MAG: SDR family oxidoreductase [Acidimicrobiales bacterium]